ncbi:ROK family protein [Streptomyces sp. NPDC001046]|uniref:ROK family transcriptional regulator n=1 Tax=Streptomyces sp. NPDC001046 TaxID=3364543 RepID=UPI00367B8932
MSKQADSALTQMRRAHEEQVLSLLRTRGALSRRELGLRSGLSRTTLHDIISGLMSNGTVVSAAQESSPRGRGRPAESITLNPGAGQAVGIDFARQHVHVAIVNVAHEIIGSADEAHAADLPWPDRVAIAERLIARLTDSVVTLDSLTGIGVGVVGPGAGHAGTPPWTGTVKNRLNTRFGVPVLVDNNTRLAALGESVWGVAEGHQDVVYLRLSHGVGGGLILGGSLHRGAHGISGELGHITVDPDGPACPCGNHGCLETVASVNAITTAYQQAGGHPGEFPDLLTDLKDDKPRARVLVNRVGALTGRVLAGVCNSVGPELVVVGGDLTQCGDAFLEPLEAALRAQVMPAARRDLQVRVATLGDAGAALGAIALVLHESPLLARYLTDTTGEGDDS